MIVPQESPKTWTVYGLVDPRTHKIRYIGVTCRLAKRYQAHLCVAPKGRTHCARWIRSLLALGLRPLQITLDVITDGRWQEAEKRHIEKQRLAGSNLTNLTDGGEGVPGRKHTTEAKAKISAAHKGRKGKPLTPEAKAKLIAANLGRKPSNECRAKISASKTGRRLSPKHRAHLSEGQKNSPLCQKRLARLVQTSRGKHHSPEHRAKISASLMGRICSPETRLKISNAKRKRTDTATKDLFEPETRKDRNP